MKQRRERKKKRFKTQSLLTQMPVCNRLKLKFDSHVTFFSVVDHIWWFLIKFSILRQECHMNFNLHTCPTATPNQSKAIEKGETKQSTLIPFDFLADDVSVHILLCDQLCLLYSSLDCRSQAAIHRFTDYNEKNRILNESTIHRKLIIISIKGINQFPMRFKTLYEKHL